jgi:hypothetical protein
MKSMWINETCSSYLRKPKLPAMKNYKTLSACIALLFTAGFSYAQTGISGAITDASGQELPFATVAILDDTTLVTGTTADEHGYFSLKQLTPGTYNVRVTNMTYKTRRIKNVEIEPNKMIKLNVVMTLNNTLGVIEVATEYRKAVLDQEYSTITNISFDQIEHMPASKGDIIGMITAVTPGVMATPNGDDLYVRGSRAGTTAYYVDGMRTMAPAQVAGIGIADMQVLTGGMPAEYGDCTGGIVVITTKEYKWEQHKKEMRRKQREEAMKAEIIEPEGEEVE